jgi:hypothetical protein
LGGVALDVFLVVSKLPAGCSSRLGARRRQRAFGWQVSLLVLPVLYVIYRSHRMYVDRLEEARERAEQQRVHAEELAALNRRTIETLALAIEAKTKPRTITWRAWKPTRRNRPGTGSQ